MDAFGETFVNESEIDLAADFLAREQDQSAGLEAEIPLKTPVLSNGLGNILKVFVYYYSFILLKNL